MDCEGCGDREAEVLVQRRVIVTRLDTGEIVHDSPADAYEEGLMTDALCMECAKDEMVSRANEPDKREDRELKQLKYGWVAVTRGIVRAEVDSKV